MSLRRLAMVIAVVVGIAGCSGGASGTGESSHGASAVLANLLVSAKAGGASEEQLAILAKGPVPSFEDYEAAVRRTITCMNDAGIEAFEMAPAEQNGITILGYGTPASSAGRTDGETSEVATACYLENSRWVEQAWQTQPMAMEAQEKRLEDSRPRLIECLERNGVGVDESLSTWDIVVLAFELGKKTGEVDPDTQVNCDVESGYTQVN